MGSADGSEHGATRRLTRAAWLWAGFISMAMVVSFAMDVLGVPYGFATVMLVTDIVLALALGLGWMVAAPAVRHGRAMVVGLLLMMVGLAVWNFSTIYREMSSSDPKAFLDGGRPAGELDSIDTLYFSMAVFTTAGFGDIVPASEAARAVVTAQMGFGVLLIGVTITRLTARK